MQQHDDRKANFGQCQCLFMAVREGLVMTANDGRTSSTSSISEIAWEGGGGGGGNRKFHFNCQLKNADFLKLTAKIF